MRRFPNKEQRKERMKGRLGIGRDNSAVSRKLYAKAAENSLNFDEFLSVLKFGRVHVHPGQVSTSGHVVSR